MQSICSDDVPAHLLARENIKALRRRSHTALQHESKEASESAYRASIITVMPFFMCTKWARGGGDEESSRQETRQAYNRRIEVMRSTEYPMLRGTLERLLV